MKYAKFAAVVLVLYFLGYVLGPTIAPLMVDKREDEVGLKVLVDYKGAKYEIDLEEVRDSALPATVRMEKAENIPTAGGAGSKDLRVGEEVKLLNRSGKLLIVQSMDDIAKGKVDPKSTDLYQTLAKQIFEREAAASLAAKAGKGDPAPAKPTPPKPVDRPVAKNDPVPAAQPVKPTPNPIMPAADPTPAPVPTPDPAPAGDGKLSDAQIEELMKKSIKGGAVKAIKFADVKGWKVIPNETIDGTDYQIGLAAYQANTVFGLKVVQAKALIRAGKIERWVHAKSNMEIQ